MAAPQAAPGAQSTGGETPRPGNPEVAFMFLLHHQGLMGEVRRRAAAGTAAAGGTERAAAASMDLGVSDFRALGAVYSQVFPLLQAIDKEADEYRDRVLSGSVTPDVAVLHQLNDRKTSIKASIKPRLQTVLSPKGWAALNSYIEGLFREGVRMGGPDDRGNFRF
jgi:hypothetical protein